MLNYDFFNATGACSGTYVRAITSQTTHLNALAKTFRMRLRLPCTTLLE